MLTQNSVQIAQMFGANLVNSSVGLSCSRSYRSFIKTTKGQNYEETLLWNDFEM